MQAWNDFIGINFAGDQACAQCHVDEYEAHQRSGHSRTLTSLDRSPLSKQLVEKGSYQDSRREQEFLFVASQNDGLIVRDTAHAAGIDVPVTWMLGSGTHAQTPIAVDEKTQSGVELRWSVFPDGETVGLTPDHERFDAFSIGTVECFGRPLDAADIRACIGCHSTLTPPPSLPIVQSMVVPNVGCERCHGPRKKHVELAHQGLAEHAQPMIQYASAEAYMKACAACHRDESSVRPDASSDELARFQPYGIKKSRCYLETPGNLTCSQCHDPHEPVSQDRHRSIDQCKQCHGDSKSSTHPQISQTVCRHDPNGDCIECHMPAVAWTTNISFHDHWIRVPKDNATR